MVHAVVLRYLSTNGEFGEPRENSATGFFCSTRLLLDEAVTDASKAPTKHP
jgi:hypothetical protein